MNPSIFPELTTYLGVDLGTSRTRIWIKGQGVVVDQPTAIALNLQTKKILAVGQDAAEMAGRVGDEIEVMWPVKEGKIYDHDLAKGLLQVWLQQILGWRYLLSPMVMVSVPAGSTQASRQAVTDLFYDLGARDVFTIAQPLAAAIGAGVPVADASGAMLCQLGAGVVEATLISLGSLTQVVSSNQAGNEFDRRLQKWVETEYQVKISQETTQKLKHQLLLVRSSDQALPVVGKSIKDGSPRELTLTATEIARPAKKMLHLYLELIQDLLTQVPPELAEDVMDKGMLISGGLAQLRELDAWLTSQLSIPVAAVDAADLMVIEGIGTALTHLDEYKRSINYG